MKKKVPTIAFIAAYCAVVIIAAILPPGFTLFSPSPSPIIPSDADVTRISANHFGSVGLELETRHELTSTEDVGKIVEILRRYYSVRDFPRGATAFLTRDVVWSITIILADGQTMQIILGEDSYHYTDETDTQRHRIINAEALIAELDVLLNK